MIDGHRELIRVFGHVPNDMAKDAQLGFERQLRLTCEDIEVLKELFGDVEDGFRALRFNPALAQRKRGWGFH